MILEDALTQYLGSVAAITDLLGSPAQFDAPPIFGLMRPQKSVLPSILIARTQTERQTLFRGTDNLVGADFQIDSFSSDSACFEVAVQVRKALLNFRGVMGTDSPGVYVDQVRLQNEFPLTDPDPGVFRFTQQYFIWYQEDQNA
jgi:hypothetical protein